MGPRSTKRQRPVTNMLETLCTRRNTRRRIIMTSSTSPTHTAAPQPTTKDYIRAEHKLHTIPRLLFHKSSYHKSCFLSLFIFRRHSTREPVSNSVTYFILRAYTGTGVSHSQHRKKIGRGFGKNAGEWTGRVEVSRDEIPGSKRSMYGYIQTYSRLQRQNV